MDMALARSVVCNGVWPSSVVSFTNMKIQVTLCKLDSEGLQVGAPIFEKNIFMLQNFVCDS